MNIMQHYRLLFIFLILLSTKSLLAEDYYTQTRLDSFETKSRYGLFFNYNFNLHDADFKKLGIVSSCCPGYSSGDGTGFTIGGLFDFPITYDWQINARLSYSVYDGFLTQTDTTTVLLDGQRTLGKFEYQLDANIATFGLEAMAGYRVYDKLFAHAGMRYGIMMNDEFHQQEKIIEPSDRGTYLDGTIVRNDTMGSIPNASSQMALQLGFSYELPMNQSQSLILAPEVWYSLWFNSVTSNETWMVHQIKGGIAMKYKQGPPPPPPPPPPIDPPMIKDMNDPEKPPFLTASIKAVEVDTLNKEKENFSVRIEDFISLNMRPLLNFVFFADSSHTIPDRYHKIAAKDTSKFDTNKLQNLNAVETYYNMLNILGKRLKENPNIRVRLVGTNSNKDREKNNKELSRRRAEAVRDYFTDVWGIPSNRFRVEARNLPKKASISNDGEDVESENRRVEIIPTNNDILEPVITQDTLRIVSTIKVRFKPEIKTEIGLKNWRIEVKQKDRVLQEYKGTDSLPNHFDWIIKTDDPEGPKKDGEITYKLFAEDSLGQEVETKLGKLPVENITIDRKRLERIQDKEFEYYSLILFNYGRSKLASAHRKVLRFVKNRLTPEAEVVVYGYSDQIGKEDINKRLSLARAKAAARMLGVKNSKVEGKGESELLFDNSLPEGRFYCRTVRIEVITPVKEK